MIKISIRRNACREKVYRGRRKMPAFLLCFALLAGCFSVPEEAAADDELLLSGIVNFGEIALYHAGPDGLPEGEPIQDNALIEKNTPLVLYYTYEILEDKISHIKADTQYYLDVSSHLVLSDLSNGSSLMVKTGDGQQKFGTIYAQNKRAWVTFEAGTDGKGTVLSELGGLEGAYFYLDCRRAEGPPANEFPIDGKNNLYAMKFENNNVLKFGYAENEPVEAKAQIQKDGVLSDKKITWTIEYTPWQNPSEGEGVTMNTPFELRDTIDTSMHSYVEDSVIIDGSPVIDIYQSRGAVDYTKEAYVLVETSDDGARTLLTFGGTKFNAGAATQGNPAKAFQITYDTVIKDELLLPGSNGGQKVTNAAELFAGTDGEFHKLDISSSKTVSIPQPQWITKTGKTTRHTDGTGSVTDWTVTFSPNGFDFKKENALALHDVLPVGSTLVKDSIQVNNAAISAAASEDNGFTVAPIITNNQPVTITYRTQVPEDMYDSGTDLGENTAWFTFRYNDTDYTTPKAKVPVGSGDGSGTSGTAVLVKSNGGYNAANRTIDWTVTINPHKANLRSGTFTDNLGAVGGGCNVDGHAHGLELVGETGGVRVLIDGAESTDPSPVELKYENQILAVTVKTGQIGAKTIKLFYTTKVCDPCIFANNTGKTAFKNTISTTNMRIGNLEEDRSASADSTAYVSASVLSKKPPVYDYASGIMKWTVEVDASDLSMEAVELTDVLPAGLTYIDGSLKTDPEIADAAAAVEQEIPGEAGDLERQKLKINLGSVTQKSLITFDTRVDPEKIGFSSNESIKVVNTITMNGKADGVEFAEVSHKVEQNFSNHGLVKSSKVDGQKELIEYEVLINPFGLALPENPYIIDTLDSRLQLDTDTLYFYRAKLTGTTAGTGQKPGYVKDGDGIPMKLADYDPSSNCFKVRLPVGEGSREAYVLAYKADIIERQSGSYNNSVHFDGGSVLLGGNKNNSAQVGGGGGGGGGGVAARKAGITITKRDRENQKPLSGVIFTLYQWDKENNERGLPFARGETDTQGKLSFKVKPDAVYELVETKGIDGYNSTFEWSSPSDGIIKTEEGILITAGAAKSELELNLTNEAYKTDIVFRLFNRKGIPLAGASVQMFISDPSGQIDPVPSAQAVVSANGTVSFPGMRRGARYFIRRPDGEVMTVELSLDISDPPKVILPDGTETTLTENDPIIGDTTPEQEWELTVTKVNDDGTMALPGAVIGLYAEESCQTLIKRGLSGSDGKIIFSGLLKGQAYWIKELEPPDGYDLNDTVYKADETGPAVIVANTLKEPPKELEDPKDPEEPENPDTPQEPENPDTPDTPQEPENPDTPDIPQEPEKPDSSGKPDIPADLENPDTPDIPADPGIYDTPGLSGNPGTSKNPGWLIKPDIPEIPSDSGALVPNTVHFKKSPQTGEYSQKARGLLRAF